mgnify:CR=1 FL=1
MMADIISIIVSVFVRFFAEWLSGQLLALFGISSSKDSN